MCIHGSQSHKDEKSAGEFGDAMWRWTAKRPFFTHPARDGDILQRRGAAWLAKSPKEFDFEYSRDFSISATAKDWQNIFSIDFLYWNSVGLFLRWNRWRNLWTAGAANYPLFLNLAENIIARRFRRQFRSEFVLGRSERRFPSTMKDPATPQRKRHGAQISWSWETPDLVSRSAYRRGNHWVKNFIILSLYHKIKDSWTELNTMVLLLVRVHFSLCNSFEKSASSSPRKRNLFFLSERKKERKSRRKKFLISQKTADHRLIRFTAAYPLLANLF